MESNQFSQLISEEELKQWSQYTRRADLLTFLKSNGIAYFRGRGGAILTTVKAVNESLTSEHSGSSKKYDW